MASVFSKEVILPTALAVAVGTAVLTGGATFQMKSETAGWWFRTSLLAMGMLATFITLSPGPAQSVLSARRPRSGAN